MQYKLIEGNNFEDNVTPQAKTFQTQIDEAIADGWDCQGGVSTIVMSDHEEGFHLRSIVRTFYTQAMTTR